MELWQEKSDALGEEPCPSASQHGPEPEARHGSYEVGLTLRVMNKLEIMGKELVVA